jgi:hypothetical protein
MIVGTLALVGCLRAGVILDFDKGSRQKQDVYSPRMHVPHLSPEKMGPWQSLHVAPASLGLTVELGDQIPENGIFVNRLAFRGGIKQNTPGANSENPRGQFKEAQNEKVHLGQLSDTPKPGKCQCHKKAPNPIEPKSSVT